MNNSSEENTDTCQNKLIDNLFSNKDDSIELKPAMRRRRKNPIPDIKFMINQVYSQLKVNSSITFYPRSKGSRGLHNGISKRRSKYVGVSKNGGHWQALINMGRNKKYIGTYCTEKEAALVYDFYAFGIHGFSCRTNFKHTGTKLLEMIESYKANEDKFNPAHFIADF
mmetsp:Transcript_21898/g.19440  ORF Transcript_21898/g.19440 Transcript_21898/m.19440 type:complete len:168 (-) Transcript_21898:31-534(-)